MKKALLLFIVIILCAQLLSCSDIDLPRTSDHFPRDFVNAFSDNYHIVDPQLAYVSASPWEVGIDISLGEYLYLALIDGVDQSQFVAGISEHIRSMGGHRFSVNVYQTADAPNPMKDWTIKSIKVLEISRAPELTLTVYCYDEDVVVSFSENYLESILSASTVLHTYDKENDQDFLNMIRNAYSTTDAYIIVPSRIYKQVDKEYPPSAEVFYYSLLVDFEECDGIIWHSYLMSDSEDLFFGCTLETSDVGKRDQPVAKISAEYADEIRGIIGLEKKEQPSSDSDIPE